jgi:hypothetical protein
MVACMHHMPHARPTVAVIGVHQQGLRHSAARHTRSTCTTTWIHTRTMHAVWCQRQIYRNLHATHKRRFKTQLRRTPGQQFDPLLDEYSMRRYHHRDQHARLHKNHVFPAWPRVIAPEVSGREKIICNTTSSLVFLQIGTVWPENNKINPSRCYRPCPTRWCSQICMKVHGWKVMRQESCPKFWHFWGADIRYLQASDTNDCFTSVFSACENLGLEVSVQKISDPDLSCGQP